VAATRLTGVIGVCAVSPDNIGSFKLASPTPAPLPTVPYVVVTPYAALNCQGIIYAGALNFIIGACTTLRDSAGYGIASVSGSVRDDECTLYMSLWLSISIAMVSIRNANFSSILVTPRKYDVAFSNTAADCHIYQIRECAVYCTCVQRLK
jgi:hypothetical protein